MFWKITVTGTLKVVFYSEPDWKAREAPDAWVKAARYAGSLHKGENVIYMPVNHADQVAAALASTQNISNVYFIGHSSGDSIY